MSSYEDLPKLVQEIGTKAYSEGYKDLMACQSPTLMAQEEPKLQRLCYVEVPEMYRPYTQIPDPASFDPMIVSLENALKRLCSGQDTRDPISTNGGPYAANIVLDEMRGSESYIENWTGSAAMAFKSNFIDPFPSVVRNQFILVSALKSALEAEQAMWKETRKNITDIAEQTLKVLDSMGGCSSNEWTMTFTVVAAVVGVAAAIPTLGTSTVLTLTAVGAAVSVVGAVPVEDPPESKISGGDSNQVLESMRKCITQETQLVNSTEDRIGNALKSLLGTVEGKPDYFVSKRPALADSSRVNVKDSRHMGYST
jgi:hypothetical protein